MDGIVVCAMDWQSSSSGVQPPPPPPRPGAVGSAPASAHTASHATTGTAGGWVACLVLVIFFLNKHGVIFSSTKIAPGTSILVAVHPATGTAGRREPYLLLVFPLGGSNGRL